MRKTVLVVDDEPLIRMILGEVLTDAGFRVVDARDGREALASYSPSVAAVVLDVQLPDADGLDLLRAFKDDRMELPVIVITGHGTPDLEAVARKAGADAFLHKPFSPDELLQTVQRLMRLHTPPISWD